ncbi:hypothetical protein IWW37_005499, partial [Coemansia sp. RSA 2050]
DFEKFKAGAVLDSNVRKIDKILSGVNEILSKIDDVGTSSRHEREVRPGHCIIYVNVDEALLKKGSSNNLTLDEVTELIKKMRNITVINAEEESSSDSDFPNFTPDLDIQLDDISPNDSDQESDFS